jgi:hypothetical protein
MVLPKHEEEWLEDDQKKVHYDLKEKDTLTSGIGVNDYYTILHCKTAKEMWNALSNLYVGTGNEKQSNRYAHT